MSTIYGNCPFLAQESLEDQDRKASSGSYQCGQISQILENLAPSYSDPSSDPRTSEFQIDFVLWVVQIPWHRKVAHSTKTGDHFFKFKIQIWM